MTHAVDISVVLEKGSRDLRSRKWGVYKGAPETRWSKVEGERERERDRERYTCEEVVFFFLFLSCFASGGNSDRYWVSWCKRSDEVKGVWVDESRSTPRRHFCVPLPLPHL